MTKFIAAGEGPSFRPTAREITDADIVTGGGSGPSIGDQLTTIEGDIVTIQGDVTTLQGDVTTLQSDVSSLQTDVAANTTEIGNILSQIANGDFFGVVGEVVDQAARTALPPATDIQLFRQIDNGNLYLLPAGASPASNLNWIEFAGGGGGGGSTSDDISNLSSLAGLTVTEALNEALTQINNANASAVQTADVGQPNGVAGLDPTGVVPLAQLPPYPLTQVLEVADATARLALSGNPTDAPIFVTQLDDGSSWGLPVGANPTIPGDWVAFGAGGGGGGPVDAASVTFDDTSAGLGATEVQTAIEALDNQVDLNASDISTLQTDVAALTAGGPFIPTSDAGAANGVAQLDGTGLVPLSQLPDLSGARTIVPDQAGRLALPLEPNDIQLAIQQDNGITYAIAAGADPSVDANWAPIANAPGTIVDSFNGRVGVVVPLAGDYTANLIGFTSLSGLTSTEVRAALDELNTNKSEVGHGHQGFEIVLDTFAFDGALSATDVNSQLAFETLDDYLRTLNSDQVVNNSGVAGLTVTEALDALRASLVAFSGDYLQIANNLSEITDPAAARANLGLGTAATQDLGDFLERIEQDLNPTLGADLQTNGFSIQTPNLVGPTETESAADIAGTFDFDYRAGTFRVFTLTNNVTLNSIQEPDAGEATTMRMFFKNSGGFTLDFTSNNGLVTFNSPGSELFGLDATSPFVVPNNSVLVLDYSSNDQAWYITEGGEAFAGL